MVHDEKAEELERRELWRRAAERWGELLTQAKDDKERIFITQHRSRCIENSTRSWKIQRFSVCDIRDAATRTLKNMGIDQKKEAPLRDSPLNDLHKRRRILHRHR
ncbi:PerC family transcriptional regulator [Escherichia coli]|uniref:PerC family transcriptional regulator n=1 Tax=Escherichia coli TaxID=562 RepID=UPI000281D8B9|nr:PerC family transcriptional regulator [Escherichia coli]AXV10985.1 PerC family transcriptional regulator [Escherichia coli]EEV5791714.1 PerC family transcriptional regulator [Escherichia coli]EEV6211583.1 PerC family transcriptional regulator [Escherichia coli]EEV7803544.1 PerC family transcriptional regulator [Escherichia coli]EEV8731825.1 PerC family transcriptional regulator [Escherichia coli]